MTVHLSARLAWHDAGWNGCICDDPELNVSCMIHEHIRDARDDAFEEKHKGGALRKISLKNLPPCSRDIGAFSSDGFEIIHYDPLDWRNLSPVNEDIPPFSFCTSPYGRMFSEDPEKTWEERPKEQLKRLNEFWSEIEIGKSLVFFYVNHGNPLKEEKSDRILIGVGRITKIAPQLYFGKKKGWDDDYPIWSRCITHNFPKEGVRLPYQEYIERGLNPSNIICTIPNSARPFFSYVAEHVSDDVAAGILEKVIQSINAIIKDGKVPESYGKTWKYRLNWLNKVLEEVWKNRGRFPGIGSVLEYLRFDKGIMYHRSVLSKMEVEGKNIFNFVFDILNGKKKCPKCYEISFKMAIRRWNSLPEKHKKLLQILSHFELSPAQIERVLNPTKRGEAGIKASEDEIIENPYVLCELDLGGLDENDYSYPIDFETIDRGMIPYEEISKIKGKIEPIPLDDDRRIRALLIEILKEAAQEGDTCLPLDEAIKRIERRLAETRRCSPDIDVILNNRKFYEERIAFYPQDNPTVIALKAIRIMEKEVRERIEKMLEKEYEPSERSFWENLVEKELKEVKVLDEIIESKAREEKIVALDIMWRFRFSVLTGYAGTGKTTTLKLFIKGLEAKEGKQPILLLAPTGKARVNLQKITQKEAQTIHQFLMNLGWIRKEIFSLKETGDKKKGASTIIIDEASMIPLDLLATLFRAIDFNEVKRIILVGDPNQLPPIGCGRPFIDIIKWLESSKEKEKHIARVTQRVRHEELKSEALKLADAFLSDKTSPGDDEILSKVAQSKVSGDLEVYYWNDEEELYNLLDKSLKENIGLDQSIDPDYEGFNKSIEKPDGWQILSPTRLHVFGTTEINRVIQRKYRGGLIEYARSHKPKPFGEQEIVRGDKVIQIVNSWRKQKNGQDSYVANGEVGQVVNALKKQSWLYRGRLLQTPDRMEVMFSTQPNTTYFYRRSEVDENLELAYAITVHKSQGSDFDKVFIVLPQKAGTMSKELLYTALTRFKQKVILLIEKDIAPLLTFRNPQYSEVFRRNTNLFELAVRPEAVGLPHPERLIHKTRTGVLVRSKSEVIVANILTDFGISYEYEKPLYSKKDPNGFRLPDFTIKYEGEEFYWEHLGMLEDPEYRKEWKIKENWYKENGYIDRVIVSKDKPDGGIDSKEIEKLVKEKILKN
ncbi:MAG: AAA family ATPase [Candidatus Bathyarchaeia archaeon]